MKNFVTLFVLMSICSTAISQMTTHTVSQIRAIQITKILESKQIYSILGAEDGVGNIIGVNFVKSIYEPIELNKYEVTFKSMWHGVAICKYGVEVNARNHTIVKFYELPCEYPELESEIKK